MDIQVDPHHYDFMKYVRKDRFSNYWYQIQAVLRTHPTTVLEIGSGDQTVASLLRKNGLVVTTADIDERLRPDIIASVEKLPFHEGAFDTVLCSEVLEHLPYDRLFKALGEIHRVTKKHAIIGLPHAGAVIHVEVKLPCIPRVALFFKIPFFWKTHAFNGEHYWELGKRGFSVGKVKAEMQKAGFTVVNARISSDDPAHYLFLLEKI